MRQRSADKRFETLLQAARDVCEVRAALTQAKTSGVLTAESESRFTTQLHALEVRLAWLKQPGRLGGSDRGRVSPANVVSLQWAGFHAELRRVKP